MIDRSHETILAPNAPTPEQLHHLTSIGFGSASSRNRIKELKRSPRSHYFIEELDLLPLYDEDVEIRTMRHRMAGRVGVRMARMQNGPEVKHWSLKFFDTTWVEQEPTVWLAQRSLYKFEWNRSSVVMSERTTRVIGDGAQQPTDMYDAIDGFNIRDDELALWHAQSEFEAVTGDDVELLAAEAKRYFGMVDTLSSRAA